MQGDRPPTASPTGSDSPTTASPTGSDSPTTAAKRARPGGRIRLRSSRFRRLPPGLAGPRGGRPATRDPRARAKSATLPAQTRPTQNDSSLAPGRRALETRSPRSRGNARFRPSYRQMAECTRRSSFFCPASTRRIYLYLYNANVCINVCTHICAYIAHICTYMPVASLAGGVLSSSRRWRASSEIRNSRGHWKRWPRISNTPAGTAPPAGGAAAHQERRPRPLVLSLADAMPRRRRRRSPIASCSFTHTVDRWCNASPAASPLTNSAMCTHAYRRSLV